MAKTIKVHSNPEVGALLHEGQAFIFVGAVMDSARSQATGKCIFTFLHDPVEVTLNAYYARAVRDGDILAADQATIDACNGGTLVDPERADMAAKAMAELVDQKIAAKTEREAAEKKAQDAALQASKEALAKKKTDFDAEVAKKKADALAAAQDVKKPTPPTPAPPPAAA